jgi:hypothetical protein
MFQHLLKHGGHWNRYYRAQKTGGLYADKQGHNNDYRMQAHRTSGKKRD